MVVQNIFGYEAQTLKLKEVGIGQTTQRLIHCPSPPKICGVMEKDLKLDLANLTTLWIINTV